MKKLMVALGAVATAASVQAASMAWNIGYASNPNGNDLDDTFTAYYFVESATKGADSAVAEKFLARSAMLTALESGSFSSAMSLDSDVFDGGEIAVREVGGFNSGAGGVANDVTAYAVIVGEMDDGKQYAFITDAKTAGINDVGGTLGTVWADLDVADPSTGDIGNWYALGGSPVVTPEPTSGLLLLLGVAGLALRRRRA